MVQKRIERRVPTEVQLMEPRCDGFARKVEAMRNKRNLPERVAALQDRVEAIAGRIRAVVDSSKKRPHVWDIARRVTRESDWAEFDTIMKIPQEVALAIAKVIREVGAL